MWILPKQLLDTFQSAPVTKELDSALEESSRILQKSLFWRGKLIPWESWLRKWKKGGWLRLLFGRILLPFHSKRFEEKLKSGAQDFLVPPSVLVAFASRTETNDICTPSSKMALESVDLPLFSWKMSKESSQQRQVKENLFSNLSLEGWNRWVTLVRQEYSQRLNAEEATREKEYLYWPTPTARDWKDGTAKACKNTPVNSLLGRTVHHAKYLPQSTNLNTFGKDQELYQLNPAWTEQLLELPTGLTELVSWETECFREQQKEPSEYSQKN